MHLAEYNHQAVGMHLCRVRGKEHCLPIIHYLQQRAPEHCSNPDTSPVKRLSGRQIRLVGLVSSRLETDQYNQSVCNCASVSSSLEAEAEVTVNIL